MAQLRFYTDEHIDRVIVTQLRQRGFDVERCQDVGLRGATDELQLQYASEHNRVILTCDDDFLKLHDLWIDENRHHAGIAFMYSNICNDIGIAIRVIIAWQALIDEGAATLHEDFENQVLYMSQFV